MSDTDTTTGDSNSIGPDGPRLFTPITEHPLPFSQDGVDELVETNPMLDSEEDSDLSVDALHEEYVNRIAQTDEWVVFRVMLYGFESNIYVWNQSLGEGFRFTTDEWAFGNLIEVLSLVQEADEERQPSVDPIEPNTRYGCPYCPEVDGEDLSSGTRPSGSTRQSCPNCGRTRTIG
ncbi:hypothetical protein [Salinibaculum rarum]|uniref:hypothetical protein n=1 Tax=Salinibaculum rarum TaxID=3058903 RepID=UPI0026604319|nr:hypothetical protein [Salinibaculum sp. KK48]